MHVPSYHRMDDRAQQLAFMRQYSFAALVTTGADGVPVATHLPFVIEDQGGALRLVAHMARANPQWRSFGEAEALVIFQGPHAYISPSLYTRQPSVPTWNYAAIHARGRPRLLEGADQLEALRRLSAAHDAAFLARMDSLPAEYMERMQNALIAFDIEVAALDARWKLSQDRLPLEREAIIQALRAGGDGAAVAVAEMMQAAEPTR